MHRQRGHRHSSNTCCTWPGESPALSLITAYDDCCIFRATTGQFMVSHPSDPQGRWTAANLPSAHALCTSLSLGRTKVPEVGSARPRRGEP
jgi:hypothetical protein